MAASLALVEFDLWGVGAFEARLVLKRQLSASELRRVRTRERMKVMRRTILLVAVGVTVLALVVGVALATPPNRSA
jgi:ABC-type Fe3+ transport system permease subunit